MKCPFCMKSVFEAVFAESQNFLAVYNLAPILPGHSLIVPKKHIESLLLLSDEEIGEMTIFSKKVTSLLLEAFHAEGFNWSVQDKEVAGQTIPHFHMHIVPRFKGDFPNPGDWYPEIINSYKEHLDSNKRERLNKEEMHQIVTRLQQLSGFYGINQVG